MTTLYQDAKAAGIPMDNHESDLYLRDGTTTRELLKKHADRYKSSGAFVSKVDGLVWIDIPFAFDPWWEKRS